MKGPFGFLVDVLPAEPSPEGSAGRSACSGGIGSSAVHTTSFAVTRTTEADRATCEEEQDEGDKGQPEARSGDRLSADVQVVHLVSYEGKESNVDCEGDGGDQRCQE